MVNSLKDSDHRSAKYSRDSRSLRKPRHEGEDSKGRPWVQRGGHPQQTRPTQTVREERYAELRPTPIGDMCSPTCSLFRCGKRALMVKLISGKPSAFCTWVNDSCIGYKCQYASCFQRYLLPNGKCMAVTKGETQKEDTFMKELERLESDDSLKNLLSRKGLGKDLLY